MTAVERVTAALARLREAESGDQPLNAFLEDGADAALRAAREVDALRPSGPLHGIPVAIKDNICTLEHRTTCGSRLLAQYRSPYEATVVRKLRTAGAIPFGKTNLDEFAMGSSTENSAFGPTRNPHDRERVPGGSSGGSAAAVAAGIVDAALGSETGGSVRQPAAFCGVVGLKPTYGRVSRYGLVAFASSLDQVGTFGRTVLDAATLLHAIAGHDPRDATSAQVAVPDYRASAKRAEVKGLVIGVPREYFPSELDPAIRTLCTAVLHKLADAGAEIRDVSLPHTEFAVPTYYVIAPAEASSNLSRFEGVRFGTRAPARSTDEVYTHTRSQGFGAEVKRRIMLGTYALSAGYYDAYYASAQRMRQRITADFANAFAAGVDLLFTPTTPTVAFKLGEKTADPYEMYMSDIFTVTANLAGIPGISVPIGKASGLPVGGQFLAPHFAEETLLRAAATVEAMCA